jgi:DNA-binding LytR/AlgR family response regulator
MLQGDMIADHRALQHAHSSLTSSIHGIRSTAVENGLLHAGVEDRADAPREDCGGARECRPERIRMVRASVGNTVRMIPAADVICLEPADKYVTVVTASAEALVGMSLRELATRLDGVELVQVHRGVMVNASCMTTATRNELGHLSLRLRGLAREVKVSRAFAHLFRPM